MRPRSDRDLWPCGRQVPLQGVAIYNRIVIVIVYNRIVIVIVYNIIVIVIVYNIIIIISFSGSSGGANDNLEEEFPRLARG